MSKARKENEGYYPEWLTNEECGNNYKQQLLKAYDDYWNSPQEQKQEKLDNLRVLLTIVCDVIAYRYLMKHYNNLFRKLSITIEEYMDYKVERMYITLRDKKDKVDDILSYIYMSFMLSSPRLIYDYAESIGRCKSIRESLPYFQVQRLKFFFIEKENSAEHIIYNVDNIDLDEDTEAIRSNLDRYSLSEYNREQKKLELESSFDLLKEYIDIFAEFKFEKSKKYLSHIVNDWKTSVEDDYYYIIELSDTKDKDNFTIFDYIRYNYENKRIPLNYDEYIDVLSVLNQLLKERKDYFL